MTSVKCCVLYLCVLLILHASNAEDKARTTLIRNRKMIEIMNIGEEEKGMDELPYKPSLLTSTDATELFSYSEATDKDFGVSRHELVGQDEFEQLGAYLNAGFWSEANVQGMPYVMSYSTREKGNYQVRLVFEYECDDAVPPKNEDKFETALIRYHEYVSEQQNQGLTGIGVSIVENQRSNCVPSRNRRNLGNNRSLLRGFRRTYVVYNLFAFCFGFCPTQALPYIPTSNRRFLQGIDFLVDTIPFLDQFKLIFKEEVNLEVTKSTTKLEDTVRIDCARADLCYNNTGVCCGQNDCTCKTVSESLCRVNACDLAGGQCCENYDFCPSLPSCTCLSQECNNRDLCCTGNDFTVCNSFCPSPTSLPSRSPTNFPTRSPTTRSPTNFPTRSQTTVPSKQPTVTSQPSSIPSSLSTNITAEWFSLGNRIESEYPSAVELSFYGERVVVGDDTDKVAQVYTVNLTSGSWVSVGTRIETSSNHSSQQYPMKVALSSDGMTVALSDQGFGFSRGLVKVVKYINDTWTQLGSDFIGGEPRQFIGSDVDLSSNGTTVAFSWKIENEVAVSVYSFDGVKWNQKGDNFTQVTNTNETEWPTTVSLTDDGNMIAIGAATKIVQVSRYNNGTWLMVDSLTDIPAFTQYGNAVSLSSNGTYLAVGAYGAFDRGRAYIYRLTYVEINSRNLQLGGTVPKYIQIGNPIIDNFSGYSVSLSSDGQTVAVGGSRSGVKNVVVRRFNGTDWAPLGESITGGIRTAVSLSASGEILAKALPLESKVEVFTYGLPLRMIGSCEVGQCGECMGDCDYDTDCSNGLKCFQRHDFSKVPGCISGGANDIEGKN